MNLAMNNAKFRKQRKSGGGGGNYKLMTKDRPGLGATDTRSVNNQPHFNCFLFKRDVVANSNSNVSFAWLVLDCLVMKLSNWTHARPHSVSLNQLFRAILQLCQYWFFCPFQLLFKPRVSRNGWAYFSVSVGHFCKSANLKCLSCLSELMLLRNLWTISLLISSIYSFAPAARRNQQHSGRSGVLGGRASSVKDYFRAQFKSNFIQSSSSNAANIDNSWNAQGGEATPCVQRTPSERGNGYTSVAPSSGGFKSSTTPYSSSGRNSATPSRGGDDYNCVAPPSGGFGSSTTPYSGGGYNAAPSRAGSYKPFVPSSGGYNSSGSSAPTPPSSGRSSGGYNSHRSSYSSFVAPSGNSDDGFKMPAAPSQQQQQQHEPEAKRKRRSRWDTSSSWLQRLLSELILLTADNDDVVVAVVVLQYCRLCV